MSCAYDNGSGQTLFGKICIDCQHIVTDLMFFFFYEGSLFFSLACNLPFNLVCPSFWFIMQRETVCTVLILFISFLFQYQIPEDTVKNSRFSYIEQGEPVSLEQLGKSKSCPESGYQSYIQSCIAGLFKVRK